MSYAFQAPTVALDTKITVQGDHGSDCVYIYYSMPVDSEGNPLCGYFHAPSLLEYLPLEFGKKFSIERLVREVSRVSSSEVRLVYVHGYPMLYAEADTDDFLRDGYSDIMKTVGQMDYFLSRAWLRLMAERRKEGAGK